MDCIQTENKAVDLFGAGKHGFQAGNPGAGLLATFMSPSWCNGVQEEILNVVRAGGLVPGAGDLSQLLKAIKILMGGPGRVGYFYRVTAPLGWVMADGKTIGSAASGATGRANADTIDLFQQLWNETTPGILVIQDAAGNPAARGASAVADFAANKRMPLPDLQAEFLRGLDLTRGVDPGRVLGSSQASAILAHAHTATSSLAGNHNHGGSTSINGVHTHVLPTDTTTGSLDIQSLTASPNADEAIGPSQTEPAGDHSHTITTDGDHVHAVTVDPTGGSESRPRNTAVLICISL